MGYINSNSFNPIRFRLLFVDLWKSNYKSIFWQLLAIFILISLTEFFVSYLCYSGLDESTAATSLYITDSTNGTLKIMLNILCVLLCQISSSLTFSNLKTKVGRIQELMLPGTQFEKYMVRVLTYSLGAVFFFCLFTAIVDGLRCLYVMTTMSIQPVFIFKSLFMNFSDNAERIVMVIAVLFFMQSYFTMISVFSPSYSFLKGYGIGFAIQVAAGWIITIFNLIPPLISFMNQYAETVVYWLALSMFIAMGSMMFYIAYVKYKEVNVQ